MTEPTTRLSPAVIAEVGDVPLSEAEVEHLLRLPEIEQVQTVRLKRKLGGTIGTDIACAPTDSAAGPDEPGSAPSNGQVSPDSEERSQADTTEHRSRKQETRRVRDIKPNPFNATIFDESLGEASISVLVEDIKRNGHRQPIEISPDGVILDGERRWRALMQLDPDAVIDVVIVEGVYGQEAIEAYIHDAHSSARDATLTEKVAFLGVSKRVLQRRHGRSQGRPEKEVPNGTHFWDTEQVHAEAAKRAGFSSYRTAQRAATVLKNGDEQIREQLLNGELSITAAYQEHQRSKRADSGPDDEPGDDERQVDNPDGNDCELEDQTPESSNVAENPSTVQSAEPEALEPEPEGGKRHAPAPRTDGESADNSADSQQKSDPEDEGVHDTTLECDRDCWEVLDEIEGDTIPWFEAALTKDRPRAVEWYRNLIRLCKEVINKTA